MTGAVARQEAAVHRFPATGADIRTVRIDDEVWLVAMDLWKRLGGIREAAA